jgi:thymidine phosphorylase
MSPHRLQARRAGIDTYQQPVVYMRSDCDVCRAEGFQSQAQVEVISNGRHLLAILHQVSSNWLRNDEIALSESAWSLMGVAEGDELVVRHPPVLDSLAHLRTKLHGGRLDYVACANGADGLEVLGDAGRCVLLRNRWQRGPTSEEGAARAS